MRHTAQLEGSRISWVQGQLTRPRGQLPQRGVSRPDSLLGRWDFILVLVCFGVPGSSKDESQCPTLSMKLRSSTC